MENTPTFSPGLSARNGYMAVKQLSFSNGNSLVWQTENGMFAELNAVNAVSGNLATASHDDVHDDPLPLVAVVVSEYRVDGLFNGSVECYY